MNCRNCGYQLEEGNTYCTNCGINVKESNYKASNSKYMAFFYLHIVLYMIVIFMVFGCGAVSIGNTNDPFCQGMNSLYVFGPIYIIMFILTVVMIEEKKFKKISIYSFNY